MNFSEFKRRLGAEPRSTDRDFQRARQSSPEFEEAAREAELFEARLERAVSLPCPDKLLEDIKAIGRQPAQERRWWPMALAASVLIAVGAAGMTWKMNRSWDSVEEYLVDHYRHDGKSLVIKAGNSTATNVNYVLSELNVEATPALADIVGIIKYCPTPDGKGVHMVLNTETGPVTVIYMPGTSVTDREILAFDNVEALLVELERGSAAIIGSDPQVLASLHTTVQTAILPSPGSS